MGDRERERELNRKLCQWNVDDFHREQAYWMISSGKSLGLLLVWPGMLCQGTASDGRLVGLPSITSHGIVSYHRSASVRYVMKTKPAPIRWQPAIVAQIHKLRENMSALVTTSDIGNVFNMIP